MNADITQLREKDLHLVPVVELIKRAQNSNRGNNIPDFITDISAISAEWLVRKTSQQKYAGKRYQCTVTSDPYGDFVTVAFNKKTFKRNTPVQSIFFTF